MTEKFFNFHVVFKFSDRIQHYNGRLGSDGNGGKRLLFSKWKWRFVGDGHFPPKYTKAFLQKWQKYVTVVWFFFNKNHVLSHKLQFHCFLTQAEPFQHTASSFLPISLHSFWRENKKCEEKEMAIILCASIFVFFPSKMAVAQNVRYLKEFFSVRAKAYLLSEKRPLNVTSKNWCFVAFVTNGLSWPFTKKGQHHYIQMAFFVKSQSVFVRALGIIIPI